MNQPDRKKVLKPLKSRVFDTEKSSFRKYQQLVMEDSNLVSLIKYELIITFCGWVPGALGILLRKRLYRYLFKQKLENVVFGKNIDIFNPAKIKIGKDSLIGDSCLLSVIESGSISISDNVSIGRGTLLRSKGGSIVIGENTSISAYSHISAIGTDVSLGKDVLMASYSYLIGSAYDYDKLDLPIHSQSKFGNGIVIEDNVWLGAGVYVLDGNRIGTGSIIGMGSIVTKDIPENSVAFGIPAKVIKTRTP